MAGEPLAAVRRERLLSRLSVVPADVPVVLLVAPPGYGKTTLLRQWVADAGLDTAWVAVEEKGRSAVRLLDRVLLALAEVAPVGPDVARALGSSAVPVRSVLVPRLAAALRTRTRPFLVVLDDVQDVPAAELEAAVALAGALPAGSHLVLTARDTRNLPLGGLRARGAVIELGVTDLALTDEEAAQVLAAVGDARTPEQVRDLTSRAEGWPVAVYLAAALGQRSPPSDQVPVPVAAVIEYLCDELLDRLDDHTVTFLLRSSVLEALSGPLCEAVLGAGDGARLAEAVERNLFLRPLDDSGQWYGYQRLVREALRVELRHREPPAENAVLGRAAQWCARHAQPEQAVAYALRGGHVPLAAAVVAGHAHRLAAAGGLATVRGWLDAFSDNDLRSEPALAVVAAWVWGLSGSPTRATSALLAAERAAAGPPPDGCASLESALLTARAALAPRGVARMLIDAQRAFELEPAGSPWRPVAAVLLGCARRLNGLEPEAGWPLELAAETGRDHQPWAAQLALAQRSLLAADTDDWDSAASCAAAAMTELLRRPARENPVAVLVHAAAARVAEREGDHAAAREETGSAVALSGTFPVAFPWLAAQAALTLGGVYLDLGDTDGARRRIDEVRRYLVRLPTEGVLRARLEDLTKAWAMAGTDVRTHPLPVLSPAELTVLRLLHTHLSVGEIAEELHVSRNTVKTQVASLYRKLDASSRSQALRRAAELGLG